MTDNQPTSATVSQPAPVPNIPGQPAQPVVPVVAPQAYAPAPQQYAPAMPREMRLPPRGVGSGPVTRRFPRIVAGVCEHCGILDRNQPGEFQYKLCPHYRGMNMKCVYCDGKRNQDDVVKGDTLNVAEHPDRPNELVVWCKSFECSQKHLARFRTSL